MYTRKQLLEQVCQEIPVHLYGKVLRIIDMEDKFASRIDELNRIAEAKCLTFHKFDPSDWLKGLELAEWMELDNQDRSKFGLEPEWALDFIELTKNNQSLFVKEQLIQHWDKSNLPKGTYAK